MKDLSCAQNLLPSLQTVVDQLQSWISAKEKSLKKAPSGRLRISRRKNQMQWFHVAKGTTEHGKYIPVKDVARAKALAQKEYDQKALPEMKRQLLTIERFMKKIASCNLEKMYVDLHEGRRKLVVPVWMPEDIYVTQWISTAYEGKKFDEEIPEIRTLRGERVRSKSEAMIADTLYRLKIPYKYECPLTIKGNAKNSQKSMKIYPDFTCLNVRLRHEFIWEHFGMMDVAEYSSQVAWKINCFEANGFFLGRNLIISMESSEVPLDATRVERIVKQYLL